MLGGSLSETHARKMTKIQDMALKNRAPIIGLFDAGGARIQEGVDALGGYGEVFQRNVLASSIIPQISVIMAAVRGRRCVLARGPDRLHLHGEEHEYMFVTGPDVVKTVTNETVTAEELGGAKVHASSPLRTAPTRTTCRRCSWPACSTRMPRARPRASCASATASRSRS